MGPKRSITGEPSRDQAHVTDVTVADVNVNVAMAAMVAVVDAGILPSASFLLHLHSVSTSVSVPAPMPPSIQIPAPILLLLLLLVPLMAPDHGDRPENLPRAGISSALRHD